MSEVCTLQKLRVRIDGDWSCDCRTSNPFWPLKVHAATVLVCDACGVRQP